MSDHDDARYVGPLPSYMGETARIKPHFDTQHLPLLHRKVLVQWHRPELPNTTSILGTTVGTAWHVMPAAHFRILVRA